MRLELKPPISIYDFPFRRGFFSIRCWHTLSLLVMMLVIRLAGPPKARIIIAEKFDHIKKFRIFSNTRTILCWNTSLRFIHPKQRRKSLPVRYMWVIRVVDGSLRISRSVCGCLCACRISIFLNGEEIRSGMDWTTLHTIENVVHWHSLHSIRIPNIKIHAIADWYERVNACACM